MKNYDTSTRIRVQSVFWYFRFFSKKSSTTHFPLFSPHFFLYYLFSPPLSYRLSTLDWLACVWYAFISDLKFPHFCDTKSPKMGIFPKKELNYSLSSFFTPILLLPSLFANSQLQIEHIRLVGRHFVCFWHRFEISTLSWDIIRVDVQHF